MRLNTRIVSLYIVLLFAALHFQPLFNTCLPEKETTCSKSKCTKQSPDEKDNTANKGCNPFVPCSMGSCCYVVENFFVYSNDLVQTKEKISPANDNRLSTGLSDFWQPPELVS
jgi:hypothetical protein